MPTIPGSFQRDEQSAIIARARVKYRITPQQVQELLTSDAARAISDAARERLTWIAFFATSNVSAGTACEHFHIARSTFRRWLERFDPDDLSSLEEENVPRNPEASPDTIAIIRRERERDPHIGKDKIREKREAEFGITLSSSTIGRVIERECLYFGDTPLHLRKRLQRQEQLQRDTDASFGGIMSQADAGAQELPHLTPTELDLVRQHLLSTVRRGVVLHERHDDGHACFACRIQRIDWRMLRRTILLGSIFAASVFAFLLLLTAYWESTRNESLQATPDTTQVIEYRSLDEIEG